MVDRTEDKKLIIRYLLGQVSLQERADLEERYFADPDLFEELLAAENDLIDSYARGGLHGAERLQFEARFLTTPELRKRVQFAGSLAGYQSTSIPSSSAPHWWNRASGPGLGLAMRFAFAGVVLGFLAFSLWLTLGNLRLRRQLEQMNTEQARLQQLQQDAQRQIGELSAQLQSLPPVGNHTPVIAQLGPPGQAMIALTLSPGLPRGPGKGSVLPISPDVSKVLLLLKTSRGNYSLYGVSLETPEGKQIFQKNGLKALLAQDGKVVAVSLPPGTLDRGDYILRLIGTNHAGQTEEIDAYSFRVVRH